MRKFILRVLLFFALVAVVDVIIGKGFDYCLGHLKGGQYQSLQYAMKETKADVLVFGSSRAINHYVPQIIEDSLGLTCYNCGFHAQGVIFQYGRLHYILNRYHPKLVIYDVEYHFDMGDGPNERYLDMLKPYCSDTCISNYVKIFSEAEYYKNFSRLYRYNSNFIDMLKDMKTGGMHSENGFEPLTGNMDYEVEMKDIPPVTVDSVKMLYVRKMVEDCRRNGVPVVFAISPRYEAATSRVHEPFKKLCRELDVPCYDYFTDTLFQNHKELFANSKHLNREGAILYTKKLIEHLHGFQ